MKMKFFNCVSMRKLIFLFLLVFSSMKMSGQIQRNFFDFAIGSSTKKEVTNYFKARNKTIWPSRNDDDYFSIRQLNFGGNNWPVVYFYFYKSKLYLIYFSDSDLFTPEKTLDSVWKRLDITLLSKYARYYDERASSNEINKYRDNRTEIVLKYDYFQGSKGISLMYVDLYLQKDKIINEGNEL